MESQGRFIIPSPKLDNTSDPISFARLEAKEKQVIATEKIELDSDSLKTFIQSIQKRIDWLNDEYCRQLIKQRNQKWEAIFGPE